MFIDTWKDYTHFSMLWIIFMLSTIFMFNKGEYNRYTNTTEKAWCISVCFSIDLVHVRVLLSTTCWHIYIISFNHQPFQLHISFPVRHVTCYADTQAMYWHTPDAHLQMFYSYMYDLL